MKVVSVFQEPETIQWLKDKQIKHMALNYNKNSQGYYLQTSLFERLEKYTDNDICLNNEHSLSSIVNVSFETNCELKHLLDRGQFYGGCLNKVVLKSMEDSQCHSNSACLAEHFPNKYKIVTGYALSDDLVWRCHSWVIETIKGKTQIIETTKKRLKYYGYVLNDEETEEFIDSNY